MQSEIPVASPVAVHRMAQQGERGHLVDVRTPAEYSDGHALGSMSEPLDGLEAHRLTARLGDGRTERCGVCFRSNPGGGSLKADGVHLRALYTPGHTDDFYSFAMDDRVFTGDTLLIRGTGRTGFQNGDPGAQYDSLFEKLLKLPEDTLVYPAHDYQGRTSSTIGEARRLNPRLQVGRAKLTSNR